MRDHKNTKKMNFGINRNVMTLIGLLLLALGAMGRGMRYAGRSGSPGI